MPQNTTLSVHAHSVYSQRDSIIKPLDFAAKVAVAKATHLSFSDHGTIGGWLALRDACQKHKLTPVYAVELYVNDQIPGLKRVLEIREQSTTKSKAEDTVRGIRDHVLPLMPAVQQAYFMANLDNPKDMGETAKQLFSRLAFGYQHLVAVAVNEVGRSNIIKLTNLGWTDGYYYKPQVTTAQCIAHSDGVIWTTACMGGPIAKRMAWDPTGAEAASYLKQWEFTKSHFYLEVQPLDLLNQRRYNQQLIDLSQKTGFPLILSQDNHHLDEEEWLAHRVLMLGQNDRTIKELEDVYEVDGREMPFSDFKKHLGTDLTWEAQERIEQDGIKLLRRAGHHYGDIRLHWRTNDEVTNQIETTNPELMPVYERCFLETDRFCENIHPIPWPSKHRLQHYDGARQQILNICVSRLEQLDKLPVKEKGVIVVDDQGNPYTDDDRQRYVDWLHKENKVISACGFWDYLWTLYQWTKRVQEEGIPIGYARGSGGGCLIMYLLGIIRVDPVKYGLYFERFLNPARLGLDPNTLEKIKEASSCPDVDLDFSSIHRKRVIEIAEELFGKDRVVPVGTITESKVRTALADLCRVIGISQSEYLPASRELPDDPANTMTVEQAMQVPSFKAFCDRQPVIRRFLPSLTGVMRSIGQHAGGVCIADVPIAEATPVVRAGSKEGGNIVTAFGESGAERALESVGFIKFDALATDTVDHVSLCAVSLYEEHVKAGGEPWVKPGERMIYPEQIPQFTENDPAVMQSIFHTGNTDGIFQMEESIGKDMCRIVAPDTIDELADISTMIRPGCLQARCQYVEKNRDTFTQKSGNGLHFEYAARKFVPEKNPPPQLPQPVLDVLKPTHYCCIYQEQMMFLIQVITGGKMSLGEGDIYRRNIELMGKGKQEAIAKVVDLEAQMKQMSPYPWEVVAKVVTIIKGGANYAFNKSHSLSYSLFSYAQAWFKHYHPHIFYASHVTLLAAKNKLSKVHKIVNNARSVGITITTPHVLRSGSRATWSEDGKTVYLPFTVIKGLKETTAQALQSIAAKCTTIEDILIQAIAHPDIKRNHLVSLARVGGFDNLGLRRIHALALVNYVMARATGKSTETIIRGFCTEARQFVVNNDIPHARAVNAEVEVFGGFINECPLDRWLDFMKSQAWQPLSQIDTSQGEDKYNVYFMITSITKKVHKSGNSIGKEWVKLVCWDGLEVCDLSIWAHDLEGTRDKDGKVEMAGYRDILLPNKVYCAVVQADGNRPTTLSHRSRMDKQETLYLKDS